MPRLIGSTSVRAAKVASFKSRRPKPGRARGAPGRRRSRRTARRPRSSSVSPRSTRCSTTTRRPSPTGSDVVVLAWPSSEAAFHRVAMPFTDKAQIERTLPFAVENEVPFELDDMVLAWRVAETGADPGARGALSASGWRSGWRRWPSAGSIRPPSTSTPTCSARGASGRRPPRRHADPLDRSSVSAARGADRLGHVHTTIERRGPRRCRPVPPGPSTWAVDLTRAVEEASAAPGPKPRNQARRGRLRNSGRRTIPIPRQQAPTGYSVLPPEVRTQLDARGHRAPCSPSIRGSRSSRPRTRSSVEVVEVRLAGGCGTTSCGTTSRPWCRCRHRLARKRYPRPSAFMPAMASASATGSRRHFRLGSLAYKGRTDAIGAALGYGLAGAMFFGSRPGDVRGAYRSLSVEQSAAEDAVRTIVTAAS